MCASWKCWLLAGAAITTTMVTTLLRSNKTDASLEDAKNTLARLRKEIKPWDFHWDTRGVPGHDLRENQHTRYSTEPSSCPGRKVIIFVRHGQYRVKAPTRDEKVLTDLGWRQAYAAGCYLRSLGIRIDRIVHSNLIRARQTTAALLVGLLDDPDVLFDVPTLANLTAPYQSTLQGNYASVTANLALGGTEPTGDTSLPSVDQITDLCVVSEPYRPYSGAWFDCQESSYLAEGPPPVAPQPPGASSTSDEIRATEGRRLDHGFRIHINRLLLTQSNRGLSDGPVGGVDGGSKSLMRSCCAVWRSAECDCPCHQNGQCETIVFVGHANVFRYWLCRALQLPPEAWLRIQLYHGSVSWLELDFDSAGRGGSSVVTAARIGEVGHMPRELLTR